MNPLYFQYSKWYGLFGWLILGLPSLLVAQSIADTLEIPTVEVNAQKVRGLNNTGSIVENWSAQELNHLAAQNVGNLLNNESGTYIKSYGLGSLATSSIRGGSAGHTLIYGMVFLSKVQCLDN